MSLLATAAMAAALMAASPASAQDRTQRPDIGAQKCDAREGLSLCLDAGRAIRLKGKAASEPAGGKLTAFARLAGMFMGRVDAVDAGSFRFRFKLEIR